MPRRSAPDPLAAKVGARLRQLRQERGITAERLVFESEVGSKGYLSDVEAGRALPSLHVLQRLADYLDVALLDLVTFPDSDPRQRYVDLTRSFSAGTVRRLLREGGSMAKTRTGNAASAPNALRTIERPRSLPRSPAGSAESKGVVRRSAIRSRPGSQTASTDVGADGRVLRSHVRPRSRRQRGRIGSEGASSSAVRANAT